MRSPWRCIEELYLLGHNQRAKLRDKALAEIVVRGQTCPMRSPVGVIIEYPELEKLVDRTGIALEITDKLVLSAPSGAPEADLLIELHRLCILPT